MKKLTGTGVAIVTPFHFSGEVDLAGLTRLVEHIITNGIDFIVALGTTSEAVTLSSAERYEVMNHVISCVDGRVPVIMGIGGNNTQAIVDQIKNTDFTNIGGILSVAPYYNKPNQRGLYEHFREIANVCPVPIILYNVPGRTSSNISSETCLKLAYEFDNIVAVKEASGDFNQIMEIIKNKPEDFVVLSGDDAITLPLISIGVEGVISVIANSHPGEFSTMVNLARLGDVSEAKILHYRLLKLINLLFKEGNPAGVKAALEIMGLISNNLRLPMVTVTNELYQAIAREIEEIKNI